MKIKNLGVKIFTTVAYLGMITVNALANALPINGIDTGQISDNYGNLFAPAGLTFSIWGLIYALLGAYVLYQFGVFGKDFDENKEKLLKKISLCFSFTSIVNILWIFAWHYDFIGASLLLMIALLVLLIRIANRLNKKQFNLKERFFILLPFTVYFGWITVATIANVTVFLVSINWNAFNLSEQLWTILILAIGTLIGLWRMFKDKNIFYGLVFVWAYFGIWYKHISVQGFDGAYLNVIITAVICLSIFLFSILYLRAKQVSKAK